MPTAFVTGGSGFIRDFRTSAGLTAAPEPGSLFLMTLGVAFLVASVWQRSRNKPLAQAPQSSPRRPRKIFPRA